MYWLAKPSSAASAGDNSERHPQTKKPAPPNEDPDGNAELYLLNLAEDEVRRLTNDENYDHMPVWLPGGNAIMFTSYASGREEIYILDIQTADLREFPTGLE